MRRSITTMLVLFFMTGEAFAAADPTADASKADYDAKMRDLDTQIRNALNTPVDFCDPVAMESYGNAYSAFLFQKFNLKREREKIHPTIKQNVQAVVQTMSDEGLLNDPPQIVEDYEAAMKLRDTAAANTLLGKMTPWEQERAAESQHDYALTFKILTPMADHGDVKAQRRLANLYSWTTNFNMATIHATQEKFHMEHAPDVPRDDALAFKYARMASLSGDEVAQEVLAKAYACGLGTERNMVQAYAWFSIATSQSALMLDTNDKPGELLRRRDYLSSQMSHDDIQRAKRLLISCYQSHYKTCD